MKLLPKEEFISLRSEVSDFINFCNENNYNPSKDEIKDIIEFVLEGEDTFVNLSEIYESNPESILNHIYDSYELNEAGFKGDSEYDNSKDWETATGLVKKGVGVALGAAGTGLLLTGLLIQWAWKRGKVKKLIQKELDAELKKLQDYQKLAAMKKKLSELKGEPMGKIEVPTMATGPELEEPQGDK